MDRARSSTRLRHTRYTPRSRYRPVTDPDTRFWARPPGVSTRARRPAPARTHESERGRGARSCEPSHDRHCDRCRPTRRVSRTRRTAPRDGHRSSRGRCIRRWVARQRRASKLVNYAELLGRASTENVDATATPITGSENSWASRSA